MVDIKNDLRKNNGFDFLETICNGVKGCLKGSIAPLVTAVLPTAGTYVAGGLFGSFAETAGYISGHGAMGFDSLFMGDAAKIFSGLSPWALLPQGIVAQTVMWGGAALGATMLTPSIVNAYRNEKEFSRNLKNAIRENAAEKMDNCLRTNVRYQELRKQFDKEELKFEKQHQQEQAIQNEERREEAEGGLFKRFFKKLFKGSISYQMKMDNHQYEEERLDRLKAFQDEFIATLPAEEQKQIISNYQEQIQTIDVKKVKENLKKRVKDKKGKSIKDFEMNNQELSAQQTAKEQPVSKDVEDKKISIQGAMDLLNPTRKKTSRAKASVALNQRSVQGKE